jgi:hypothetical protein
MPDSWERACGLDPHDPRDSRGDLNGDGYTNVEEYLNDRDPTAPPPIVGAGAVPDGGDVAGSPLMVWPAGGNRLTLAWGASCVSGGADYEIYAGQLGDFASHSALFCSTNGQTALTFEDVGTDAYFLVVARDSTREGSYGRGSSGAERPVSWLACLEQTPLPCP